MTMNRRGLLLGLGAVVAAPAIVRASSLMKIKVYHDFSSLDANVKWLHDQILENISATFQVPKHLLIGKPEDELAWSMAHVQNDHIQYTKALIEGFTPNIPVLSDLVLL